MGCFSNLWSRCLKSVGEWWKTSLLFNIFPCSLSRLFRLEGRANGCLIHPKRCSSSADRTHSLDILERFVRVHNSSFFERYPLVRRSFYQRFIRRDKFL